ncbi:MAG: DUF2175 domain-containing protein [Desulfurococcales archaeon]|nr:DUF2175 domain-containing protein [Desulfurococcales archaeon]
MPLSKWKCVLCGEDVIEGQRFFYIPGKGYAHAECVYERLAEKGYSREVAALMDANEVLAYAIVRLKEAARIAGEGEVSKEITDARKKIEGLAAKLEKMLVDLVGGFEED